MSYVRLAAVQYRPPKADPTAGRDGLVALVEAAASNGARVIVAPEMATCGYVWASRDEVEPHAEPARGPTWERLAPIARAHEAWIVVGIPERASDGTLYNAAIVIDGSGELVACYRKVLLFDADRTWAAAGTRHLTIETPWGPLVPGICMDINDDRFVQHVLQTRPWLVAFCTNWVDEGVEIRGYWRARLLGSPSWLLAADTWGDDGAYTFFGRSSIVSPAGRVVADAGVRGDRLVLADVVVPACTSGHTA